MSQTDEERVSTLSGREKEVLILIAEGLRTRELASRLHVSTKTVDTHRQNIMKKTGLETIPLLTKLAVRLGWSTLDE